MKIDFKKGIALIVAVVLAVTTLSWTAGNTLRASDDEAAYEEPTKASQEVAEEKAVEKQEVVLDEKKDQKAEEKPAATEPTKAETEAQTTAETKPAEEATAAQVAEDTPEAMPAVSFTKNAANNMTVEISAPEGALPEGTKVQVSAVGKAKALSLISDTAPNATDAKGVDITFKKDGKEIEPKKAVKVTLKGANLEGSDFAIYHVNDQGKTNLVTDNATGNGGSFKSADFSIYIVATEESNPEEVDYIKVNVNYVDADGNAIHEPWSEEVVKDDNGNYVFTKEIPEIDNLNPQIGEDTGFSLNGNTLTATFTAADKEAASVKTVDVVYRAEPAQYIVHHMFEKTSYSGTTSKYEENEAMKQTVDGYAGELTEAEANESEEIVAGFNAKSIDQVQIKANKEDGTADTDVYVYYDRKSLKVTYDTQGGSYVAPVKGKYGETVTIFDNKVSCGKEEHTHVQPSGNASWRNEGQTSGCYTCQNTGWWNYKWVLTCGKEEHTHSSACMATTNAPTRTGYEFTGWYLDAACKTPAKTTTVLEDNMIVYAGWKAKSVNYTIAYQKQNNDGSYSYVSSKTASANVGDTVTGTGTVNISQGGTNVTTYYHLGDCSSAKVKADGSTVVYVKYDLNTYKLEFDLNTNSNNIKLTIGGKTYNKNSSSKYTITCRLGDDISTKWPTADNISGDTLYGWTRSGLSKIFASKRFEVTTDMIGDTSNGSTTTYKASWTTGTKVILHYMLQNADDNDYTDAEKYRQVAYEEKDSNYSAKQIDGFTNVTQNTKTESGVKNYYFYYDRNTYNIDYKYGSTSVATKSDVRFDKNINTNEFNFTPNRPEGVDSEYEFKGWYDNADCVGDAYAFGKMPASNLVLYAKWQAPEKKVTIKYNNGTADKTETVLKGSTVDQPETPTYPAHNFLGWYSQNADGSLGAEYDFGAPVTKDITIAAKWEESNETSYTVKYITYSDTGDVIEVRAAKQNTGKIGATVVEKPMAPTGEFADKGYIANAASQSMKLNADPKKNVITFIYSQCSELSYTVKYMYGDEVLATDDTVTTTSNIVNVRANAMTLNSLAQEGYELDGKSSQKVTLTSGTNEIIFKMKMKQYTITYKDVDGATWNGSGTNPNPSTYTAKDSFTLTNPSKDGVVFLGWDFTSKSEGAVHVTKPQDHTPGNVSVSEGSSGNLEFTARWATFNVNGYEGTYDGMSHTISLDSTIVADYFGYTYSYSTDGVNYSQTMPSFTNVLRDKNGNVLSRTVYVKATSSNGYVTLVKSAKVKINPAPVTLTSANDQKEYDGKPLTNNGVVAEGFIGTDGATYDVTGTQTVPGSSANSFTYELKSGTIADNYEITTNNGTLTVNPREEKYAITVVANSDTAKYDGNEKKVEGLVTTEFTVDGNTYTVEGLTAKATGTDAGTYAAAIKGTAVVKDAAGNDVTSQFDVTKTAGSLTISPREVTLTSGTATKVYDGKPLTNEEVTVSGDGFADGEGAAYTVTGSQKLVGSSENTFTYALNEGTKKGNYTVTVVKGTLTVTNRDAKYEIEVEANSGDYKYDGAEKKVEGLKTTEFTVDGNTYTVEGLTANAAGTNAGTYAVNVTGTAVVKDAEGNDVTGQFAVTTKNGSLNIAKRTVTLTSGSATKEYDGVELTKDEVKVSGDGFADGEGAAYSVTGSQLLVGESDNAFTYSLKKGTDAGNYTIKTVEGKLTVTDRAQKYAITVEANSQETKYDGQKKTVEGFKQTSFEIEGHTYTVEGLTANAEGTDAGTYEAVVEGTAVVKDASGNDVTGQFAVETKNGSLKITKRTVTLTSGTAEKQYDGTALTDATVTVGGDGFADGEGAEYDVTGSQLLVGTSDNEFTYNLKKGTAAGNYTISQEAGKLTVKDRTQKYDIEVEANSDTVKYDGTVKSVNGFKTTEFTVGGNTYTVEGLTASQSQTNAGTYTAKVEGDAVVKDAAGNDVTGQFNVTTKDGSLKITKRAVSLTSATDEKTYDGNALTNNEVTVGGDGFADGEGATYDVTGTQTVPGSSANSFTYELKSGTIADNYEITTNNGTLTVNPREEKYAITVVANSDTAKYDGNEKKVEGLVATEFTVDGNTYTVEGLTAKATGTDAGTYAAAIKGTAVVKDAAGNDVTSQFDVTKTAGSLTISPREVTLTSGTATKVYDGKNLTNDEVTVSGDGFADGEGAAYTVTGSQKLVGSSENTFTYALNEGTKKGNYTVTVVKGTLTVTNRDAKYEIEVEANSGDYKYDGAEKKVEGLKTTEFTVDGNTYTVEGLTANAAGTNAGTYAVNVTGTAVVKDAEGNDVTGQFAVTTKNGSLNIAKRTVTLTSGSATKEYDGVELTKDEVKVSGDGFADGEGAAYSVTGSQLLVGESDNAFTYSLKKGTDAGNYTIKTVEGKLTVTDRAQKYAITVEANSQETKYDGQKKTVEGFKQTSFEIEGHTYTVEGLTANAEGTDAGTYEAVVEGTAVVKDASGNDVTGQFAVETKNGSLKITKRTVTLTSGTAEKQYDGTALTDATVTVGGDGFADGEGAEYDVTGSQLLVGTSDNEFTYNLKKGTAAKNYTISQEAGKLTVKDRTQKYDIEVEANSDTVKYDGTVKSVNGFKTTEFTVGGNTYTVEGLTASQSQTNAGTYTAKVEGDAVVKDAAGNDVTGQFNVTTKDGSLKITKRAVSLTSATDEKTYDGNALTNNEVTVGGDGFADGEGATYDVTGTQTVPGSSANSFTYELKSGTIADNYEITTNNGTLTVNPREEKYAITVVANSDTAKYDGNEKKVEGLVTTEFTVDGNTYTVEGLTAKATGTDAGTYAAAIKGTAVVKDAAGNDVTSQFDVTKTAGSLTISPREVTLTSGTATKVYDGKNLTNDEVTVSGDGFADGEGAAYTVTGSQKLVGSSENTFTYALNEGTKKGNYTVTVVKGTLTVTNRDAKYEIEVEANSGDYKYDGAEKKVEGLKTTEFTVDGNTYTVEGLTANAAGTNAGTYAVNVTGTAVVKDAEGNDVTGQFAVTTKNGSLNIAKRTVTLTSGSATKEYDGVELTKDEVKVSGDGFADGEGAAYSVTGSQLLVGESDNAFTYSLKKGTDAGNYTIKTVEGKLTVTDRAQKYAITVEANSQETKYDGQKKTVEGFKQTSFEIEGHTYTVEGLTANAEGTDAGTYEAVVEGTAVVKDASGNDVTGQFAVETKNGSLKITKRTVTLTSGTAEKQYDGTALTDATVTVGGDGFADGEGAEYDVTGSQLLVGTSDNEFTYNLKKGTAAGNYTISQEAGKLTVKDRTQKYDIEVEANSDTVKYDGTVKSVNGFKTTEFTVGGNTYTVEGLTASQSQTNAGTYTAKVEGDAVVKDAAGNDVTGQFNVTTKDGSLKITKRAVSLTSATDEKTYDGNALTNNEVTVGGDGFADGEGATYDVTGTQTVPGSSANSFTYELKSGTIADNYEITTNNGTLTVNPREEKYAITVVANSDTAKYDGNEKKVEGLVATEFTVDGNTYTVEGLTAKATGTDAGTYAAAIKGDAVVKDAAGNDVTSQFDVTKTAGSLTISPREVTLTSGTATKVYDGKPLTNEEVTVSGDGFADGEGAAYTVTGSQKLVGSSENTFTYALNEGTKKGNYTVTVVKGTLTVTNRDAKYDIEVEANSGDYKYDGAEKKVEGLKTTEFTVDGNTYTVEGLTANASGTNAGTYAVNVTGTAIVKDAEGNDVTGQFAVTTKNGSLNIAKRTVTLTSGSASKIFDTTPLTNNEVKVSGDGFADGEGADYTVTGSQTDVGKSDNVFTYSLKKGTDAGNYTIKTVEGTLEVTEQSIDPDDESYKGIKANDPKNSMYDGNENKFVPVISDADGNKVADSNFNVTYKRGAEETTDFTNVGTITVIITGTGNYKGTITKEYKITKREVILTSATATKVYDGTPLTKDEVKVSGDGFAAGEGADYNVTGSQTKVGTSDNKFTYELKDGTSAGNYTIKTVEGTLTVTSQVLDNQSVSKPDNHVYDGKAHKWIPEVKNSAGDILTEGVDYTVEYDTNDFTNVTGTITVTIKAKDGSGYEGTVTRTYQITKAPLTVATASASKKYDGKALTKKTDYTFEGLVEGETAGFTVTGTQTKVGISDNTYEIAFAGDDNTFTAKEGNYEVTTENIGKLEVIAVYKLVIHYVDANGNKLAKDYTGKYAEGDKFNIESPVITGYTPNYVRIVNGPNGMPARDLEFTVVYTAVTTGTPAGGGGNTANVTGGGPAIAGQVVTSGENIILKPIDDNKVPLASADGSWALINLLLTILTVLLSLILIAFYIIRKKNEDNEELNDTPDDGTSSAKKKLIPRVISAVWAILMIIVFILTEDMSMKMAMVDKWTILMAIMTVVQIIVMIFAKKKFDDDEEDSQVGATA